jgi:hypothetical protein
VFDLHCFGERGARSPKQAFCSTAKGKRFAAENATVED